MTAEITQNETSVMIFDNEEFGRMRTLNIDGEPWFVGKDVAEALGYERATDAVRKRVDDEDRGVARMETPSGSQNMTIINESGLYSLILSSKLPNAKKFKHWVTSENLPSVRKTGRYDIHKPMTRDEMLVESFQAHIEEIRRIVKLEEDVEENRQALEKTNERMDNIKEIVGINSNDWREKSRRLIVRIANSGGKSIAAVTNEIFGLLSSRAGVNLKTRKMHKIKRMELAGVAKSKRNAVTTVDIIAEDKKLTEIYLTIVKEIAVKYGVADAA